MESNTRSQLKLFVMAGLYILLASLGIYSTMQLFIFPILAVPWALYSTKEQANIRQMSVIHLISALLILLVGQSALEAILYLVIVGVPSMTLTYYYQKKCYLPQIIIYNGVAVTIAYFVYVAVVKQMGFDYIAYYFTVLDEFKNIYFTAIDDMVHTANLMVDDEQVRMIKSFIITQIDLLKMVYPSLFLIVNIGLSAIYTFIFTIVGRMLKRVTPSFRALGQFTFSKILSGLLMISMIYMPTALTSDHMSLLMMNLFFLATTLMQLLGFIVTVTFIRQRKWNRGIKVITTILIVMFFPSLSVVMMSIGVADTLFNFRKVDIII